VWITSHRTTTLSPNCGRATVAISEPFRWDRFQKVSFNGANIAQSCGRPASLIVMLGMGAIAVALPTGGDQGAS